MKDSAGSFRVDPFQVKLFATSVLLGVVLYFFRYYALYRPLTLGHL